MKKFCWLTSVVCLCCCMAQAQQEIDTATKENLLLVQTDSVFADFSYQSRRVDNKIVLHWHAASGGSDEYYIIQRSTDDNNYETIGAIKKISGDNQYELSPGASITGNNFYRIKYIDNSGNNFYSKSVRVAATQHVAIKVYPNPVDKLLIVETDHPVEMQLINSTGAARLNASLHQGLQVIDVSTLEKGTYILLIIDNNHNRNVLQQLVKN